MPVLYSSGGASALMELVLPPNPATNLLARGGNNKVSLTWTDPEDRQESSKSIWDHSVLIRKQGSAPNSVMDGTKVLESSVKNQYSTNAYIDTTVSNDIEYFYAVYTYSTEGAMSETAPIVSVTPRKGKIMTVVIDLNDSNPATCGSYADNAIGMPYGKTEDAITAWQEFFGYRPCLFKDGEVVGYLNPNDYSKFEDGNPADITSGDAGDVMVEFPRRGVKISKSGRVITVSMTDDSEDSDFTYYAHSRGKSEKKYFYLGAYLGYEKDDILRSISGIEPTHTRTAIEFRQYAHNRGTNYEMLTFYQLTYIQAMYLLQFKGNLNSQDSVGHGHRDVIYQYPIQCGTLNKKSLIYGNDNDGYQSIKLFGLEDAWGGEIATDIEGCYIARATGIDRWCIYTATDNFVDEYDDPDSGYTKQPGTFPAFSNIHIYGGYMTDVTATSETGFLPIRDDANKGSDTTYFCDYSIFNYDTYLAIGLDGQGYSYIQSGLFAFNGNGNGYQSWGTFARLSYY